MMTKLRQLETDTSPVRRPAEAAPRRVSLGAPASSSPRSGFLEWTEGGGLRAPVFLGLRDDKPPADVVRET